jgi:hypothetical protein
MSATDLERQVKLLAQTRTLNIKIPETLFEEIRASGKLQQVDLYVSLLIVDDLTKNGWLKKEAVKNVS